MSWSFRRQLLIIFLLLTFFGGAISIYYYFFLKIPISCTDGKQNQGELDVDCGGPCQAICDSEILPLTVEWVRPFKLLNGKYDVAAMIVNWNSSFGIPSFDYTFSVYDERRVYVSEKSGSVFINPGEKVLLFASNLDSGDRSVSAASVQFNENKGSQGWVRIGDISQRPKLFVENERVVEGDTPRLYADIVNSSPYDIRNVDVAAVIYDENNNAMAVSKTVVALIKDGSKEEVVFTWPAPFPYKWKRVDILPRIDYITGNN